MTRLSLIVPCHNEAEAAPLFVAAVTPYASSCCDELEVVFIDDGSTDATLAVLEALARDDARIRVVVLSRNFGKEAALTAGLTYASGDIVIPMDCDLQDPPAVIPLLVAQWRDGALVVQARRRTRTHDAWLKRTSAHVFYRVMSRLADVPIPENAGDFRLMDRRVVAALLTFPERNRFMKGLMAACGFRQAEVWYDRAPRAAGATKFNFWRLWNFALDGITGFTTLPLRVWSYVGALVALAAVGYAAWTVARTLFFGVVLPGYASLLTVVLLLGAAQLIGIGILGEYLARVVKETKRRPLFLVSHLVGFDASLRLVEFRAARRSP
jgi:glycosyltransferase involved in cell wall biosynthesis